MSATTRRVNLELDDSEADSLIIGRREQLRGIVPINQQLWPSATVLYSDRGNGSLNITSGNSSNQVYFRNASNLTRLVLRNVTYSSADPLVVLPYPGVCRVLVNGSFFIPNTIARTGNIALEVQMLDALGNPFVKRVVNDYTASAGAFRRVYLTLSFIEPISRISRIVVTNNMSVNISVTVNQPGQHNSNNFSVEYLGVL